MKRKIKMCTLMTAVMALSLTACGGGQEETTAQMPKKETIVLSGEENAEASKGEVPEASSTQNVVASEGKSTEKPEEKSAEAPQRESAETAVKETAKEGEIPDAYTTQLALYSTALEQRWSGAQLMENELNYMMVDCYGDTPFQNIGYAIEDLDGNGSPELIVGTTANVSDDFFGKLIFELYTLDENGALIKSFNSWERNRYYYAGDNLFANLGSSSASDSVETTVKWENNSLTDLTTITPQMAYVQLTLQEFDRQQGASGESSALIQLPILDEINQNITVGTTGCFMTAVQVAVDLLDWGTATGLDPEEIRSATLAWLTDMGNDKQVAFAEKLALVDEAYQKLLGSDAKELLSSAGCEDAAYPWSDAPVESIEAIMEAVGLR